MAFPQTPLGIAVELLINGTWTDVSTDVRSQGGTDAITISRGITSSGGMVADRGTCSLTLDNNSGKYSSRNPTSPYFGYLGRNTRVRVAAAYGAPWLSVLEAGGQRASTPDAAILDIAGDLDIRADIEPAVWGDYRGGSDSFDAPSYTEICGKWTNPGQGSWALLLSDQGQLVLVWSTTGANQVSAWSTPVILPPFTRQSVRVTLDVDNGAGGFTATFYTSSTPGTAGPWTQVNQVMGTGVTSIFNSTSPAEVGDLSTVGYVSLAKKIFSVEVRNGIGGTVVANPNFEAQAVGATSFNDTAPSPRPWTATAGAITNKYRRFTGEVSSWPPQWDTGGKDVTTPITASGLIQRLGQRKASLQSTLTRRLTNTTSMLAYWPMEDGSGATQAASPLPGVKPLAVSGLTFASDSSLAGSGALPQLAPPSSLTGSVPVAAVGDWHVEMVYKLDTLPAAPTLMFQVNLSGGTAATVQVLVGVAVVRVQALDASGTVLGTFDTTPNNFTDNWGRLQILTSTSGGTVTLTAWWLVIGAPTNWNVSTAFAGTPGRVTSVSGSWGTGFADLRIGHIGVMPQSVAAGSSPYDNADKGFDGESAAARLARVASEQNITMSVAAHAADTELVGPQPQETLTNVLQAAAQADEGLLYEARESLGLRFRGRRSLENQPSLDLPYVATPQVLIAPLTPVDDDQGTLNDSTVNRTGGSWGRSVVITGALSTQDPPGGVGLYDENITENLHSDDQTQPHAAWRTYLGTWNEARFPQVNIELAKNPALIPGVARIDTGSRIRITPPLIPQLPPDPIDNMVLGYMETLAQFSWRIGFACVPYGPYRTAVTDDYLLGRVDTDGSTLAASALSTDTTISVATPGLLWTTDPFHAPWNIRVGGEVMRVDAVGSIINTNPYLDTSAAGWTATGATAPWSTAQLHPDGAAGALFITPNGSSASGGANAALSAVGTITAGASYVACLWAYSPGGWSDLRPCVDWYDASGTLLSSGLGSATSVPAGAWTFITQTLVAPASASRAVMRARHGGTPASSNTWYAWGIRLLPVITTPASPQTFQVTRSRNTVVKTQSSGADVRLDQPATVAL